MASYLYIYSITLEQQKELDRLLNPQNYRPLFPELGEQFNPDTDDDPPSNSHASTTARISLNPTATPATPAQIKRVLDNQN